MASLPLVTVVCLSFNHVGYLEEAVLSVINQTYSEIQLILVDDASNDGSQELLQNLHQQFPQTELILLPENVGNCRAFNQALQIAKGKYIIDLSADDILYPNRIEEQVLFFESQNDNVGLIFSDCEMVDKKGKFLRTHYQRDKNQKLIDNVPSGFVFQDVLRSYFICTPTMMMRKAMLDELEGYDEKLSYEDFDLWVRASKKWHFVYQDCIFTKKRVVENSLGTQFYRLGVNAHLRSTLSVCKKAYTLCTSPADFDALKMNISYHLRQSLFCEDFELVKDYFQLRKQISRPSFIEQICLLMAQCHFPAHYFYQVYRKIK